ncbi:MAG: integrase [Synechococcales bacterium]|nr:integrase [Synechococcales bacterium]
MTANPAGLKLAIAKAKEVDAQLVWEKFDWTPYLKDSDRPAETVGEWLEKFEADHWSKVQQTPKKLNSWHKDYELKFNHLPEDQPLTIELLRQVIEKKSSPSTRSRQGYVFAFRRLAEFAGLPGVEVLKTLSRGYSSSKSVQPRDLPTDAAIADALELLPPDWQWLYKAMAIYGLRSHEVFRLRTDRLHEDPPLLEVTDNSKTGSRIAYPIENYSWCFDIQDFQLPAIKVEGRNNNRLGMAISQKFRQKNLGFIPYALRHCYARRGFEEGYPPDFLAVSMGHSLQVHLKIYRAWWGEDAYMKVFKDIRAKRRARADTP